MRKGNDGKSASSSPRLDCDVGLGLKMPVDSYYCDGVGHNLYDGLFAQRSFLNTASRGIMGGKGVFTASQWEELERQKIIHKYILASVPVPPQLLLPRSTFLPHSQCNIGSGSGLELRFSSSGGSDPEAWRCKRTDGKKWRCSRDVAPDLKYCERHAHKSRPRSRKLVELSSHKPIIPSPTPNPTTLPLAASNFTSYDQTRCIEWFMKGGNSSDTNCVSISTEKQEQEWRHLSSTMEEEKKKNNMPEADFMNNPYIPDTSNLQNQILDPKTRLFIDAWDKEGYQTKGLSTTKFPISPSSLTLSMYDRGEGSLGMTEIQEEGAMPMPMMKPQWMMNSVSWTNCPPGGPLGEALCLGNATTTRGTYGYSTTNTNSNTNSSKSSCEDGSSSYALNFIGDS